MPGYLEITVDKFTFRVPTDRLYAAEGIWHQPLQDNRVRVGLGDLLQQTSGDVTFATVKPSGTRLAPGDEFAEVETMKATLSLTSPLGGLIVEVNDNLDVTPEIINQDPYERGWLAVIEVTDWETARAKLLDPSAYFALMQSQIERELKER
jgi:glycine cleavage system H protein